MDPMTLRVLVVLVVTLLVVLPVAQQASAPCDAGHAAALKHAPRTAPWSARMAVAARPITGSPAAPPFAGLAAPEAPDRAAAGALSAPFVPPRGSFSSASAFARRRPVVLQALTHSL